MRYLQGTLDFGTLYKHEGTTRMKLLGWTDSNYAGDEDGRKNTSRDVFKIGSGSITWSSKKQPIITLSTTETEFITAASCACQGVWLRNVLAHLKMP